MRELFFVWFGGLIRGAIAFGLVLRLESESGIAKSHKDVIITTTLVLVIFTTIVFGSIMPLVSKCLLKSHSHDNKSEKRSSTMNLELAKLRRPSHLDHSSHHAMLHPNMQR